jgi:protein phosphatase
MIPRLDMHAASHIGLVRQRNEDSWWFDTHSGIAVVADGMGGHPAGADASALAVSAFADTFGSGPREWSSEQLGETMAEGIERAHDRIRQAADDDESLEGMGTTLTALAFGPDGGLVVGHVGDSRAYRYRDDVLELLTHDQTWVADAIASGRLSPRAASAHPLSHVLTQAVGVDLSPTPDVTRHEARNGDVYLLCSDGLTGPVSDELIHQVLADTVPDGRLDEAAPRLIEAALAAGGPDNITAVLVRFLGVARGAAE